MTIQNIDKEKRSTTVILDSDELVMLCNCLHEKQKTTDPDKLNPKFHELYGELILARDVSQYGHIDNFTLTQIIRQRQKSGFQLKEDILNAAESNKPK